jgi:hypothetical protein
MAERWFGGGVGRCPAYWSGQEARRSVPGARVGLDKLPVSSIGGKVLGVGEIGGGDGGALRIGENGE